MLPVAELIATWWTVPLAYVIGATPFGFLAGKAKGIDIRRHGSGNIGATNVLRTLGKPIGFSVLALDILKGMLPVLTALLLGKPSAVLVATALAAIFGHNYTFWLGFKGGKGIATTGGALLPILPIAILVAVAVWIVVLKTTRYVSVASIAAALAIPLTLSVRFLLEQDWNWTIFGFATFVALLAIWKHRANIARLRRGEENRFEPRQKKSETPSPDAD